MNHKYADLNSNIFVLNSNIKTVTVLNSNITLIMVTHSSTLAWRIPWMEEPARLQPMGLQRVGTTEQLTHTQSVDPG